MQAGCKVQNQAPGGREAAAAADMLLPVAESASDRLLVLGALPLTRAGFPAAVVVDVDASDSGSGSEGLAGGSAAAASSAFALLTSLSSCSLYRSAAGDVYCTDCI